MGTVQVRKTQRSIRQNGPSAGEQMPPDAGRVPNVPSGEGVVPGHERGQLRDRPAQAHRPNVVSIKVEAHRSHPCFGIEWGPLFGLSHDQLRIMAAWPGWKRAAGSYAGWRLQPHSARQAFHRRAPLHRLGSGMARVSTGKRMGGAQEHPTPQGN